MISLYGLEDEENKNPNRSPLDPAINFIKSRFKDSAYFQNNYDVVFLYNFNDKENQMHKELLQPLIDNYHRMNPDLICHVGISSIQTEILESINDNLLNIKKFMKIVHVNSKIIEYDQMGFFKLFYNIENLDELLEYVPSNVQLFIKEKAEFAKTLTTFLSLHQNYVKTGERMFVHPKTVRYRIEKAVDQLGLDLNDENMLLSLQVALKICEYTGLLSLD
jgi:purine catabolism regulator